MEDKRDIIKEMQALIDNLNNSAKLYEEGHPIISDREWDNMYFDLVALEKESGIVLADSPTSNIIFKEVSALKKVTHNHPMLSLNKTKDIDELKSFIGDKDFIVMPKMDGLTCSLFYQNGKLIRAETRGDGKIGEDITHNALVISSIPKKIPYYDDIIVDGEIICTYENFNKVSSEYKNPRNYAAGSIRLLDARECSSRNLTFVAWDLISNIENKNLLSQKLSFLIELNFTVVPFAIKMPNISLEENIEFCKDSAKTLSYPIDGVVIKYNNCEYYNSLGATEHHFRGGLAFKFYDEEYESTLINIEWTMGRTGQLTPIAIFEPIDIDGTEVSRASLHNISIMEELWNDVWFNGLTVHVIKSNQIIPQITKVELTENLYDVDVFDLPSKCPICGGDTKIITSASGVKTLVCPNERCEGKALNKLDHFCGKKGLDIKGLSKATLSKLMDWGWISNITEIFSLENFKDEWAQKAGFGTASVNKILNAIEESRNTTLTKIISAAGIPLVGNGTAKDLERYFKTYDNFREYVKNGDFTKIKGFGSEINKSLKNFDYSEIDYIVNHYLKINNSERTIDNVNNNNNQDLKDFIFVITGKLHNFKNRDELKSKIESMGGKVASSVTSKTDYLINNDVFSNSAKNKDAQRLNIPIITEDEFLNLI